MDRDVAPDLDRPAPGASGGAILRSRAGRIGVLTLSIIALACFGTLPWTLGWFASGEEPAPYRAQALDAAYLPPFWAPYDDDERGRLERVSRRLAAEEALSSRGEEATASAVMREMERVGEARVEAARPRYWLGTDQLGRSVLARCLAGGAVSIGIGLAAAGIAVVIGTLYGSFAGMRSGRVDAVMMRVVDILYGLPYILLVVLLAVAVDALVRARVAGAGVELQENERLLINVATLLVAIGGVSWLTMARVVRGETMSIAARPFMEAARASGATERRQFTRHLLPNLTGVIVVYATLTAPQAILQESFLSFLGIGVQPPLPSWGNLAADGVVELNLVKPRWWLLLFPSALLGVTLLALNFVGEGLREAMDPRSAKR
jgi:ABC-type dipeptide/oligopeptide/nickel transport system permease subunit